MNIHIHTSSVYHCKFMCLPDRTGCSHMFCHTEVGCTVQSVDMTSFMLITQINTTVYFVVENFPRQLYQQCFICVSHFESSNKQVVHFQIKCV